MLFAVKHYILFFNVLTLVVLLLNLPITAQNKNTAHTNFPKPIFEHITVAEGLPENSVRCILQDHLGYMWFGTQNGLVKYDGYNMTVYQPNPDDSLSISNRQVRIIYEDRSGILWIGTEFGLNYFDRTTETFTSYLHNPDDSTSINSNNVESIYEDRAGNFWVGGLEGLNLFDKGAEKFSNIRVLLDDKKITVFNRGVGAILEDRLTGRLYVGSGNKILFYDDERKLLTQNDSMPGLENELGIIQSFYQAIDGTIWIGHSKGLARLNSLNNTIKYYQPRHTFNSSENNIDDLMEDEYGFIWGTNGFLDFETTTGLFCFDPQLEIFKRYKHNAENQNSLSGTRLWSLYKDNSGIIWVGSWGAGLNKWDRSKHKFNRFSYDPNNPDGERFNRVLSVIEDSKGIIWLGTYYGLYSFNRFSNEFQNYKYDAEDKYNTVQHIYKDESGIVWFGTETKGLGKLNVVKGTSHFFSSDPNDSMTISNNDVMFILPGANDILWIGTWGGGLNRFNKKTGVFSHYTHDSNNLQSLSHGEVSYIFSDRKGTLWIGTDGGGLNRFDQSDGSFESFDFEGGTALTYINAIYEDHQGNFWIGTYHSGIHLFDRDKGISVYNVAEKDGLANNMISSILEDDSGNLWIGTDHGLSRFDPQTRSIKNYFISDDFERNSYWTKSAIKTSTGEMLFGTYDGFIIFHPDSIKDDPIPPQVVISNVSLFNKPGEKLEFDGVISELSELDLSYNENDLRFDYIGLHYGEPEKNQYKYMLENFDEDWVDAGTQRNATYTNLDAGEYVFRVTASNRDGVWNEEGASLTIIIPPPFWATWWAYSFYVLFALGLFYSLRRYELNRTLLKSQHKLDEVRLQEREETDRMKSRFFANISHEFRTPLTLILGPSENIITEAPSENATKQAGAIKRNANRLLALINQLLDLSKLEAGKLELKASKNNIVSFIKGTTMSFESVAEGKDVILKVKTSNDEIELYFDKEKMIKIMTNLLSNSFKFTQKGEQITVTISESDNNSINIKVKDTGQGIAEEELPKLFDRFYQVDSSQTREHEGTGIGLALTKELIELHHGTISVDSKIDEGTEFTIELPVGRRHLKDEEIVEEEVSTDKVILSFAESEAKNLLIEEPIIDKEDSSSPTYKVGAPQNDSEVSEDKNIILVVEDNADVREFIKDSLGSDYQIEEASNGEQGVRKAGEIIPDLILSDIMMPKMDGFELCNKLKTDEKTSHIPIILLTAKSEQESKLEGLETGADDYLTKPFDTKELQIRIKNLINIRRELQKKYSKGDYVPVIKEEVKKLSNLEEQFMHKVMEVIEGHISEEEFSIEQFGKEVGMSRVQLHRKLKALSGKSASNYLRSVRLSKAKKMIKEDKGNISEIAYSVGFSSPAYFTRCFKEEYGYPPSDLTN